MKPQSFSKQQNHTLITFSLSLLIVISLLTSHSFTVLAQENVARNDGQDSKTTQSNLEPFQQPLSQTDTDSPTATTNVCNLPGAIIDDDDFAYENDDIQVIGCQGMINGEHTFNSLMIQNGTLVHGETLTMTLTINGNALVAADAAINVSARGYAGGAAGFHPGEGPGGGEPMIGTGGGGGHGGYGGTRHHNFSKAGLAYGDPYRPLISGSGGAGCSANSYCQSPGGDGGAGGGAVHLDIAGTLTVDGNILANGAPAVLVNGVIPGAGGAGGSIWLEAATFSGSGQILANGGNGAGTRKIGGGGGRIAIYYGSSSFSGTLSAQGGQTDLSGGYTDYDYAAGAGTIYLRDTDDSVGQMRIINRPLENTTLPVEATTPLDGGLVMPSEAHNFSYFDIRNSSLVSTTQEVGVALGSSDFPGLWAIQGRFDGAAVTLGSGLSISLTTGTNSPNISLLRSVFDGLLTMDSGQDLLVGSNTWLDLREPLTVDEIIINTSGRLGHVPYRNGINPGLDLTANSITVATGGQIYTGGRGYPGAPASTTCMVGGGPGGGGTGSLNGSGAGYGGTGGGFAGGGTYGSAPQPVDLGSGGSNGCGGGGSSLGAGGAGGGRVHLNVTGTLALEGVIYAHGAPGEDQTRDGGGGSGGSIWIEANTFTGNGVLNANGGSGSNSGGGGGGGGGRIALDVVNNSFNGTITANPGPGAGTPAVIGTIIPGDLFGLSKSATPEPALAGEVLTYTLVVRNNSTEPIDADIIDTLPPQITAGGPTSWNVTIPAGGTWTEILTGTVDENATGILTNLLEATVDGTTRAFTLQTSTEDSPISGLSATNNSPAVETEIVVFNASVASGSGVTYNWDFGDGSSGQGATAFHAYTALGTYIATVTAVNNVSSAVTQTMVTILEQPNFAGLVWHDLDGDGQPGPGEPGLDGATVSASGSSGSGNTSTGSGGQWILEGLPAGTYTVDATYTDYEPTTANPLTLPLPGAGSAQADFGLIEPIVGNIGRLTGRMFNDLNGNGLPEINEPVFAGQTVALQLPDGSTVNTAATDANGYYSFSAVGPGTYQVNGTVPAGYYPNPMLVENVLVVMGEQTTVHLPIGQGGTMGGLVETTSGYPLAGATLTLSQGGVLLNTAVTSGDGTYAFGPIPPGEYELSIMPPSTYLLFDGVDTRMVTVANNVASTENWTLSRLGSLRVIARDWIAANNTFLPISGVTFTIQGGGTSSDYTTGFDGQIELEGLPPGEYTITYQSGLPADATINPNTRTVSVANDTSAEALFTINLSRVIQAICREWGEPAFGGFPCTVEVSDSTGVLVTSQTLLNGGVASFLNLSDGTYDVHIIPANANWPTYHEIVVVSDGTFAEVEYPFNPSGLSSIWGYAFKDNFFPFGTRSTGTESSYADANGLTVNLLDEAGSLVASTTTAANYCCTGYYRFEDLAAGVYRVEIELPQGYNPTTATWAWRTVDFQTATEEMDFGFQRSQNGQISGRVYYDYDGDGTFTNGLDNGRGGEALELRAPDGSVLDTTTTAPNGNFQFSNVASGEYSVYLDITGNPTTLERLVSLPFENPSAYLEYALRPNDHMQRFVVFLDSDMDGQPDPGEQRFGGVTVSRDDEECGLTFEVEDAEVTDSNGVAVFDLISRTFFGCARILPDDLPEGVFMIRPLGVNISRGTEINWIPMVSGGTLLVQPFWDTNGDGVLGSGESVLTGIRATVGTQNANSGPNGASFTLPAGSYSVSINEPENMVLLVAEPLTVNVAHDAVTQVSVPLQYAGSISGAVLSQGGTPTWSSLTVMLWQTDGGYTDSAIVSQMAPSYQFVNVPPGTYILSLSSTPSGWGLLSQPTFYYPAQGLAVQPLILTPLGSVSGVVYLDKDGNGHKGSSDPFTNEYPVTLVNNLGTPPQTVMPASDGSFIFTGLQPSALYAVTLDLGNSPTQPGASITQAPGWFSGNSGGMDVSIGVFPYIWPDGTWNVVYGQVTANGLPIVGAEVGYYPWDDDDGCDNPTSVNGSSITDANGRYQLQTIVLPYLFPDGPYYCIQVIDAPGFVPTNAHVVLPSYTYSTIDGLAVLSTIDQENLEVEPASQILAPMLAENQISWSAFRDDNANGARDTGEPALPGTVLQSGALTSTTGPDGSGMLTGLTAGKHSLTIIPVVGYTPIDQPSLDIWLSGESLVLPPIGFRLDGALVGSAFADNDGDGWQASDESGIGNITITLSGPVNTSVNTQLDGTFLVQDLPDGQYTITAETPAGFAAVGPQNVTLLNGGVVRIPMQATGQISGAVYEDWDGDDLRATDEPIVMTPLTITLDFGGETNLVAGNFLFWDVPDGVYTVIPFADSLPTETVSVDSSTGSALALPSVGVGQVRGTVWHDLNQDGIRQPGETPLSGVVVTLDNGASTMTDEQGRFRFLGVTDGLHNLDVTLPEGFEVSIPSFTTGDGRGAVVGIAAGSQAGGMVFLPMVNR